MITYDPVTGKLGYQNLNATSLATISGPVDIFGNPPVVEQVLIATSSSTAVWQTNLSAANLSGTIASGVQLNITRLGTIVSGTWNGNVIAIANGGTNSSDTLNNNRIMVSSGGKIVETSALTNGQLLIGVSGGMPAAATLTAGNGVLITNSSGSITLVSIYGTERVSANSVARTTRTANTYATKLTLNTGSVVTSGTYRIDFSSILDASAANKTAFARLRNSTDAVTYFEAGTAAPTAGLRFSAVNTQNPFSGFVEVTFTTSGVKTINLDWASQDNSTAIGIQQVYLAFYRTA